MAKCRECNVALTDNVHHVAMCATGRASPQSVQPTAQQWLLEIQRDVRVHRFHGIRIGLSDTIVRRLAQYFPTVTACLMWPGIMLGGIVERVGAY
mmetsp:Transcript_2383/g.5809  ORF Transcript_2383/g.5809 Transcript_2383/m.5809 type:complete len:95 (+) Transcript_2383:2936-3220(+)